MVSRCRSAAPARSRSACRRCATSARVSSRLLLAERDERGPFASFHDFVERVPEPVLNKRAVESLIKAGAFDSVGHPRKGLLGVFEHVTETTVTRRRERDQGVMSLFGDWEDAADGPAALVRRTASRPRPRVRQDRQAPVREGDARAVRVRPPAVRRRGRPAPQGRARHRRRGRARGRRDGAGRRRRHRAGPQVHPPGRPDGRVRPRGPRRGDRGDAVPAHADRARAQARRRPRRRREGPSRSP